MTAAAFGPWGHDRFCKIRTSSDSSSQDRITCLQSGIESFQGTIRPGFIAQWLCPLRSSRKSLKCLNFDNDGEEENHIELNLQHDEHVLRY